VPSRFSASTFTSCRFTGVEIRLDRSRANGRSVRVNSIQANVHMLRYLKFGQEIVRSSGSPRGAAGYLVVDWRCRTLSFLTPR